MGSIGLLFVIRQAQTAFPSLMALTTLPKLDTNLVAQKFCPKAVLCLAQERPLDIWLLRRMNWRQIRDSNQWSQTKKCAAFIYCFPQRNKQRIAAAGSDITSPEISGKTMKGIDSELPSFKPRIELSTLLIWLWMWFSVTKQRTGNYLCCVMLCCLNLWAVKPIFQKVCSRWCDDV